MNIIKFSSLTSWTAFFTALTYAMKAPMEVNVEVVIIALTGVIAVVSTLIGVVNTVKNDAFKNSQTINSVLEKIIEKQDKEIEAFKAQEEIYRENRIKNDDYIRMLARLLSENNIAVPPFIHPPV